ncbi:hypothetical protein JUN65_08300 [Gluconacetobacter azotocaptans]|uniref:hypothetical protein n=1 Tax=Gluconacetobacter azotocaptans TaxID=142834 RepID=UPI00195AA8C4|nr:hypothetical protein [Gluconacetobacter azotocaptans]MBM9401586.1 hypothetical protein [Gluconacetobacter azotocaptans]
MTPSDIEDAIARLQGQAQAHAMTLTAMLVAMPPADRATATAILSMLQKQRVFLADLPLLLHAEVTAEATADEIERVRLRVAQVCAEMGR